MNIVINAEKDEGLELFGIRAINVAFNAPNTITFNLDSSTTFHKSTPTRLKNSKKNSTVQPSEPRLFYFANF